MSRIRSTFGLHLDKRVARGRLPSTPHVPIFAVAISAPEETARGRDSGFGEADGPLRRELLAVKALL